jgi:superfamily II DNA or RNA helicase
MDLRRWQQEALNVLLDKKKLLVEVGTGCGKTFFTCFALNEIIKQNRDFKVLIVLPKIVILNGWLSDIYKFFPISDVGFYFMDMKEYAKITLTTTASLKNIVTDLFDVIVADEVHNLKSERLNNLLNSKEWAYKIGLSATIEDKEHNHLKLEKSFNYNKYEYDLAQGIKDNILNSYEWYNYPVILDSQTNAEYNDLKILINSNLKQLGGFDGFLKAKADNKTKILLNQLFDKRNKLIFNYYKKFDIFLKIIKENKDRKIIVFNQYNETGNQLVELLILNNFKAKIVNSDLSSNEKEKRIKEYENGQYNILITSKMFDEGYNVPSIDTAIIFSGDSTERQTRQRVGRVLRKKDYPSKIYTIFCENTVEESNINVHTNYFKKYATRFEVVY